MIEGAVDSCSYPIWMLKRIKTGVYGRYNCMHATEPAEGCKRDEEGEVRTMNKSARDAFNF